MEYDELLDPASPTKAETVEDKGLLGTAVYYRAAWTPGGLVHPKCAGEWASFGRYIGNQNQKCAKCGERLGVAK